jgi:Holliday junction DNA helicase RuvB
MRYIGQMHIMNELVFLLPKLLNEETKSANILLRGPSGYGKTTLALAIAHYLAGKDFELYWANMSEFRFRKRVVFIDEIHKVPDLERLFQFMDSRKHVIIFATNQSAELPEAFSNRCWEYIFDDYETDDLLLIAMESSKFSAPEESYLHVIEAGNRNPRIIKSLVDKLGIYFEQSKVDSKTADFKKILEEVFHIQDGLDTLARRYLEVLEDVGGTASITLLKNILHVDKGTIENTVEPVLLRKGLVKITAKGRTRIYD